MTVFNPRVELFWLKSEVLFKNTYLCIMEMNNYSSSSESDDEDIINFVVNLGRIKKIV
jgi:hypothetical protein